MGDDFQDSTERLNLRPRGKKRERPGPGNRSNSLEEINMAALCYICGGHPGHCTACPRARRGLKYSADPQDSRPSQAIMLGKRPRFDPSAGRPHNNTSVIR